MKTNKVMRVTALTLGVAMSAGFASVFAGCGKDKDPTLVVMSEELNELFNPFYSTAGSDIEVVGHTQIGMLGTDKNGDIAYGENEPTVVLDYKTEYNAASDTTDYYFVLKNGITFSDGVPLTMGDVLFNLYVLLDPAYSGSTTIYSTDIVGLQAYRTQTSTTVDGQDDKISSAANGRAVARLNTLINLYHEVGATGNGSYSADETTMLNKIASTTPDNGYMEAIGLDPDDPASAAKAREQLKEDYKNALEKFKEELKNDYKGAKEAYIEEPYKSAPIWYQGQDTGKKGFDEVLSFMYMEGYVTIKYPQAEGGTPDKTKIEKVEPGYNQNTIKTEEAAIKHVYDDKTVTAFDQILMYFATGSQLQTEFTSKAKDVILHEGLKDGELAYKNISGIVSLGHTTDVASVEIKGKTYPVAQKHDDQGRPANNGEYDVLRITINKIDPKAIWNFGFNVAPHHYYSDPARYPINIEDNQFGVEWASFDFHASVLQGVNEWGAKKNRVPLGAGPYVASNRKYGDKPGSNEFIDGNVVYYKANEKFLLGAPKIKKMNYLVVSPSNALGTLQTGGVHFVTPQFTKANGDLVRTTDFQSKGLTSVSAWQLGYGYIGINAKYVKDINLRKAIMSAMNTSLALTYYAYGTCVNISWPMSLVSWAYPRQEGHKLDGSDPRLYAETNNEHAYTMFVGDDKAKENILDYMKKAGVSKGNSQLKLKFTIAGSSMTEHPIYAVFLHAMELLNECGWDVEIQADTNALTKLSTGSLAVWAAAWGSTIDPDMYQVYHKNSTATSVVTWGYPSMLDQNQSIYSQERDILTALAGVIDAARETDDKDVRTELYRQAMSYVLDLAVEMPVYQRQTLYAYNINVIKESSLPSKEEINSYNSPLGRIWEVEFAD